MKRIAMVLAVLCIAGPVVAAGTIERACNNSDRQAASRSLCGCIQGVANIRLTAADQNLAAKFFEDPHMAQEVRQSDNAGNERFWKRYKLFGQSAAESCS